MSNKTYKLTCGHCTEEFTGKSSKARFCSSKCRTAAHRHQKNTESDGNELVDMVVKHWNRDKLIALLIEYGYGDESSK